MSADQKIKALLNLRGYKFQYTECTKTTMSIATNYFFQIDTRFSSDNWKVNYCDGKEDIVFGWKDPRMPVIFREKNVQPLVDDYKEALDLCGLLDVDDVPESSETVGKAIPPESTEKESEPIIPSDPEVTSETPFIENVKLASWEEEQQMKMRERNANKKRKEVEEEKARALREENEKRLAMMEEAEKAEEGLKEQRNVQTPPKSNPSETPAMFEDRPVEYVDAPAPKKGEVNLFDVLNKICKHDLMQIFGNTGTGKTSLCTKLALDARAIGKTVMYIDTEGSINDDQIEAMKKTGTKYEFIKQFPKLCETVKRLPKVNVLIVDSAGVPALASYCKSNLGGQGDILKKFIAMSDDLKTYASDNNSLVVVINQPESSMGKGEEAVLEPFGEKSRYYYKEILKTAYAKRGRKTEKTTLVLRAHRSRCMGIDTNICTIEVTNDGVKVIQ